MNGYEEVTIRDLSTELGDLQIKRRQESRLFVRLLIIGMLASTVMGAVFGYFIAGGYS